MASIRHTETSPADDVRETPIEMFAKYDERFHFTLDAAALPSNALCSRFYTLEQNGLERSWRGERVWCNPPFSQMPLWVEKAWRSEAELVCMVSPGDRTGNAWWQDLVEPYRDGKNCTYPGWLGGNYMRGKLSVEFRRGRDQFTVNGGQRILSKSGKPSGAMFSCVMLIWS